MFYLKFIFVKNCLRLYMFDVLNLDKINLKFRYSKPEDIINYTLSYPEPTVLTTNFGPYEIALVYLINSLNYRIPIIWIDTGFNTNETYDYVKKTIYRHQLKILKYEPKENSKFKKINANQIPNLNTKEHELFTHDVKIEPFNRAMKETKAKIWITNIRKGQTKHRDNLDIFSFSKNGILRVSPFFYWSDEKLNEFIRKNELEDSILKIACKKSIGRSEKWYRREKRKTKFNRMNFLKICLFLGSKNYLNLIRESCIFIYQHSTKDAIRYKIEDYSP